MREFLFWGELSLYHRWIFKMTLFEAFMVPLARAPLNKLWHLVQYAFNVSQLHRDHNRNWEEKKTQLVWDVHWPVSCQDPLFQWPLLPRPHGFVFSTCLRTANGPLCPSRVMQTMPLVHSLSYELILSCAWASCWRHVPITPNSHIRELHRESKRIRLTATCAVSVEVKACLFIPTNTKTQISLCLKGKLLLFPAELWNKNNISSKYIALTTI